MKLLFDIGNTTINWAVAEAGQFSRRGKNGHGELSSPARIRQCLGLKDAPRPSHVLVSSVAAAKALTPFRDLARGYAPCVFWQARASHAHGQLKNAYHAPERMGSDRWLALVAAWASYRAPLCLVICGTALTIDLIGPNGPNGRHLGGYIAPGLAMMQQALIQNTAGVKAEVGHTLWLEPGADTQRAITAGACLASVALIDRVVAEFSHNLGMTPHCLISGGAAGLLRPALRQRFIEQADIVLRGLLLMHEAGP